ncbi:MAG TPA: cytochrome c [Terriglobales bacterium]|nr:cytochrome c [Terriglobales bacterium]
MAHYCRYGWAVLLLVSFLTLFGCEMERRKSDAELGLNPQQANGRRVFDRNCARCHEAYSSRGLQGPSLKGIYKRKYFPSGLPANDARMSDVVLMGKAKMPSFRPSISDEELQDLIAYLHTL